MRTTQDVIDSVVTQISPSEIRFKEQTALRGLALFGGFLFGGMALVLLLFAGSYNLTIDILCGIGSILLSLWMFHTSLPHELHLNFHYRMYNELRGIGPFAQTRDGSFDEISSVYVCRYTDRYGLNPTFTMGFAFGDAVCGEGILVYTRPCYNVLGVRNSDYLQEYAQNLATKMGVVFQCVNY